MRPICKFCGKEIHTDHYFITKNGSCCLDCGQKINNMMKSFRKEKVKNEVGSDSSIHSDLRVDSNE